MQEKSSDPAQPVEACCDDSTRVGVAPPTMRMIGATIRALRKMQRIRQADLAAATQTHVSQLHRIEHGEGEDMGLARFLRICEALGASPAVVLALATAPSSEAAVRASSVPTGPIPAAGPGRGEADSVEE